MSDPIRNPNPAVAFERQGESGVWSIEMIDDDGGIEQTIFIGPRAEERAKGYAVLLEENERLTNERDQAQGLLREAAQGVLSTKSAVEIMRSAWRRSAAFALKLATDDPATDEQWRAFGAYEAQMACAGELDPEKASIFEPCELVKARTRIAELERERDEARSLVELHKRNNRDVFIAAETRITEFEEALRPFAQIAQKIAVERPGWDHDEFTFICAGEFSIALKPFRRAKVALGSSAPSMIDEAASGPRA